MLGDVAGWLVPRSLASAPAEVEALCKLVVVVVAAQVAWMKAMAGQKVH